MFRAPFQNPGTSKGLKKCLNAKRHSGQLACGSDNPLAPFNNIFPPLKKFQQIPPKSHGPHLSALRKFIQSVRFASFVLPVGSSVKQNRLRNHEKARLEGLTCSKAFRPRLAFHSADYSMTFPADKAENRPHFENLSARVESVDG